MIATHTFRLVLERAPVGYELDELDDADFYTGDYGSEIAGLVEFRRTDGSLVHAIASGIADLEGHGLSVLSVGSGALVYDEEIEARADKPRWQIDGQIEQSPVAHPKPMAITHPQNAGAPLYAWAEVREWLAAHGIKTSYDETIAAANAALSETAIRDVVPLEAAIQHRLDWSQRWQMPEWMLPYCSYIANTGGTHPNTPEQIELLIFRLDCERNLAFTNIVVFTLAAGVKEQVSLLTRLYDSNCLLPPITDGGW
jgi:hypothetical protein